MRSARKPCARKGCPKYLQPDAKANRLYCSTSCRMKVYRAKKKDQDKDDG
jgi:hypothetical protein